MHLQDKKSGVIAAVPIVGSTIPIGVGVVFLKSKMIQNKKKKFYYNNIFW